MEIPQPTGDSIARTIITFETLLLLAATVAVIARRFGFPYSTGLVIVGTVASFAHIPVNLELSRDLIFFALLPPILFESALKLPLDRLRDDALLLGALVIIGVCIVAATIGYGMSALRGWALPTGVLLGAILAATDPVSVIAMLRERGIRGRQSFLVEAESLINDGTAATLYVVALAFVLGDAVSVNDAVVGFARIAVGGILCGLLIGGGALLLTARSDDPVVETAASTFGAYGAFLIAERCNVSGVLATLTAGVLIGNSVRFGVITPHGRERIHACWELAGFVANSIVFLVIGMQLPREHFASAGDIIVVIALALVGRALAVYCCCALFAGSRWRVPYREQHVLVWGGLRGALALALVTGLPADLAGRGLIVTAAYAVVVFSLLVQATTVGFLVEKDHLGGADLDRERPAG